MKAYVTGYHRAGTHSFAKELAKKYKVPYLDENIMAWNDYESAFKLADGYWPVYSFDKSTGKRMKVYHEVPQLRDGFVFQCPHMASRTIELSKHGQVYWCVKNEVDIATSMKNGGFQDMSWDIVLEFYNRFCDDPIWGKLLYNGKEDRFYGFVQHHMLMIIAKEYFFRKYFKDLVQLAELEKQPYYKPGIQSCEIHPLNKKSRQLVDKVIRENARLCDG